MNELKERFQETKEAIRTQPIVEGEMTKQVENQTAKIPSMFFLSLGLGSIAVSAGLKMAGKKYDTTANFIGQWVPTFLLMGIYNKLVKIEGNDRFSRT